MPFAIKPKQTVLFIGDSITDCGRRDSAAPLGNGYPRMVHELIMARHPAHKLSVINKGIGGNTVKDLAGRWVDDVLKFNPDWLSIKIGINDLHRWMSNVQGQSVTPEEYLAHYDAILALTKKHCGKAQIILMDPFYISEDNKSDFWRSQVLGKLPLYIKTVDKMAKKYKTRHIRTHEMFKAILKHHSADALCPEPVHPYASGHLAMANAWMECVGG
ncbi:MAG: SGNH/GDSL hydrolase family protein [Planctomycetota bacterium]|nr:SGNH/GDSL hydrolase family protein [Planctomycetota bacterium]